MRRIAGIAAAALAALAAAWAATGPVRAQAKKEEKPVKFIGAAKCKSCHNAKKTGEAFAVWQKTEHAKAFEVLGGDKAKEIGKAKGIPDPQKAPECLRCHVTAHGEPAERLDKKWDPKLGVQCETCHGPGEKHFKARMAAAGEEGGSGDDKEKALVKLPAGEILARPPVETCLKCHNTESPSFEGFCFKNRLKEIRHWDPRKKRTEADIAALECGCGEKCACTKAECGGWPEPREGDASKK
ncbi:MAG: cytochrome c family protein [Planctomycetales bacterium]|nr:cytochrome c family protein [Planctomycetales bacterium]